MKKWLWVRWGSVSTNENLTIKSFLKGGARCSLNIGPHCLYYQEHLLNLTSCRKPHDRAGQNKLISPQMKIVSALCDTEKKSKKHHVFYMKDGKEELRNQVSPATDGHVQKILTMVEQTDTPEHSKWKHSRTNEKDYALSLCNVLNQIFCGR